VQVDVGLIEPVEQYQAVCPGPIKTASHVRKAAEERTKLDRHRDRHHGLDRLQNVKVGSFNHLGRLLHVGCDVIDV
jgi:hypothetical protein